MEFQVNNEECALIKMLLSKEEVGTRIEMHHCRTYEYKELLKKRENRLHSLIERIEKISPELAEPVSRMGSIREEEPDTAE